MSINKENIQRYGKRFRKYEIGRLVLPFFIKEISNILKLKPITIYKRIEKIRQQILKFDINFA